MPTIYTARDAVLRITDANGATYEVGAVVDVAVTVPQRGDIAPVRFGAVEHAFKSFHVVLDSRWFARWARNRALARWPRKPRQGQRGRLVRGRR